MGCCCCSASPQQKQKGHFHLWASQHSWERLLSTPNASAPQCRAANALLLTPTPQHHPLRVEPKGLPPTCRDPPAFAPPDPTHSNWQQGGFSPRGPSVPSPPEAERPRSKRSVKHGCVYWLALSYSLPAPPAHTEFLLCVWGGDLFSIMILFCPRPPRHTHRDAGSAELLCTAQLDRANTQLTP